MNYVSTYTLQENTDDECHHLFKGSKKINSKECLNDRKSMCGMVSSAEENIAKAKPDFECVENILDVMNKCWSSKKIICSHCIGELFIERQIEGGVREPRE